MRGHIVKRYNNSYSIVLDLGTDPATGKRKQQWVSVKGTKADAQKRLTELLHQLDTGTYMKPGRVTVADYLEQWLKDYAWANLAPTSAEGYQAIIRRYIIPSLGQIPLTQLRPAHLQKLYTQKAITLSNRSVRYIHVTLHRALKSALKMGLVMRNVADSVEPPKQERHEMRTMTESDMHLFLELAKSTPYYSVFYFALFSGMRRSEFLALRWSDVDLLLCQASVNRTIHRLRDRSIVFRPPKTQKSRRLVALSPSTVAVLREHKLQQEAMFRALGWTLTDDNLIFSQFDGSPLLPDSVSHTWTKLARRCGLNGIRLHDARHTHASLMLKQGIHPKIVQERLGHSSIQITLDTYSHVTPGLQEAAANRFDEVIASKDTVREKVG